MFRQAQKELLEKAVKLFGSQAGLARYLGINSAQMSRYVHLERELPEGHWNVATYILKEVEALRFALKVQYEMLLNMLKDDLSFDYESAIFGDDDYVEAFYIEHDGMQGYDDQLNLRDYQHKMVADLNDIKELHSGDVDYVVAVMIDEETEFFGFRSEHDRAGFIEDAKKKNHNLQFATTEVRLKLGKDCD